MFFICTKYDPKMRLKSGKRYSLNKNHSHVKILVSAGILVDAEEADIHEVRKNASLLKKASRKRRTNKESK